MRKLRVLNTSQPRPKLMSSGKSPYSPSYSASTFIRETDFQLERISKWENIKTRKSKRMGSALDTLCLRYLSEVSSRWMNKSET